MSWTFESEPQSQTTDEGDTSAPDTNGGNGSSPAIGGARPVSADDPPIPDSSAGDRGNGDVDDDEGPLDPSLFFGLFDDLDGDDTTTSNEPVTTIDEPVDDTTTSNEPVDDTTTIDEPVDDTTTIDDVDVAVDGSETAGSATFDDSADLAERPESTLLDDELQEARPDGELSTGDRGNNDSDVVVLGGDPPAEAATELEAGEPDTGGMVLDDPMVVTIGSDVPEPESPDDPLRASDTAVTLEPVVEAGILQPVVSPPKVFSPTSDADPSTRALVDEPQPPIVGRDRAAGPRPGAVVAFLIGLMVALIAAVVAVSGGAGSETDAAEDADATAPADEAETATGGAAVEATDENGQSPDGAGAQNAGPQEDDSDKDEMSPAVAALARELAEGRLDLTSIRFRPGTVEPDEDSRRLIEELAAAVLASGGQPISVVVRTYSEAGPVDNQTLSEAQAAALVELLAAEGVPADELVAVGLGSGPLSPQQPVPDFVVVNPELGDALFKQVIADIGTFTLGSQLVEFESGRSSDSLRIESLAVVDGVGQALATFEDSTIGLAGYSYFGPDNELNRARAGEVSNTVARRLSEVHGIGPDRITIITPGAAPYVVTPEIGNHVWIRAGARTATAFRVAGVDASAIEFEPGSATPTPASTPVLDQLAAALADSTDTLVIDVRTYSEASGAANMELSEARAEAIAAYLVETGQVEAERLRAFGSGASSYFADNGGFGVTLTVIP